MWRTRVLVFLGFAALLQHESAVVRTQAADPALSVLGPR